MSVVTIGCRNGHVFSACIEEEAKGIEWYAQVGYYAQQGCQISTVGDGEWRFASHEETRGCDQCKAIKHEHEQYTLEDGDEWDDE